MAGSYKVDGDILAQGINCLIRIDTEDDTGSNPTIIGFVETYDVRKNITIQRAEVIGEILPVSLDPTNIQTTITLGGFIPSKQLIAESRLDSVRGGGGTSLKHLNPDDSKLVETKLATKVAYLDLYDYKHKTIIGYTNWAVCSSYQDSGQGKNYIKANATFEGIGYNNGPDYPSEI